jgi:hypothetical protein
MRNALTTMAMVPKKRTNDMDQERMGICSLLVKA